MFIRINIQVNTAIYNGNNYHLQSRYLRSAFTILFGFPDIPTSVEFFVYTTNVILCTIYNR